MKDQYTGDVNDFLKYAVLRTISVSEKLGVVWMLTPSDGRRDGRRLSYLARPEVFRDVDPIVFDTLAAMVKTGCRTVRSVERANLLPNATFVSNVLLEDVASRGDYFRRVWEAVIDCSVVFFDPDNGIEVGSVKKGGRHSSKYLYCDELAATYQRGHSILLYQHFPRKPRSDFLNEVDELLCSTTGCERTVALATSYVAFIIIPQRDLEALFTTRLAAFSARSPSASTALFVGGSSRPSADPY